MQTDAKVEADDQEIEVVAQSGSCAQRNVLSQAAQLELSFGFVGVVAHQPYVARVEECGAIEIAGNGEAVLHVGFNLEVAHLVDVGIGACAGMIGSGTDASDGKRADAVGAANGEQVVVGGNGGVAIAQHRSAEDACGNAATFGQPEEVGILCRGLHVLCEGHVEELFVAPVEWLACNAVDH